MRKSALLLLALLVIPSNIGVKNLNSKSSIACFDWTSQYHADIIGAEKEKLWISE